MRNRRVPEDADVVGIAVVQIHPVHIKLKVLNVALYVGNDVQGDLIKLLIRKQGVDVGIAVYEIGHRSVGHTVLTDPLVKPCARKGAAVVGGAFGKGEGGNEDRRKEKRKIEQQDHNPVKQLHRIPPSFFIIIAENAKKRNTPAYSANSCAVM